MVVAALFFTVVLRSLRKYVNKYHKKLDDNKKDEEENKNNQGKNTPSFTTSYKISQMNF